MSGLAEIYMSTGLLGTLQFERALEEESQYIRPAAFYELGRYDEAFALAYNFATDGYPETLFALYNRAGRSQEVTSFLEERWPSLEAFAVENRGGEFGYPIMAEVALAYSRTGNMNRFEEAMLFIEAQTARTLEQGVDNAFLAGNRAIQYALLGDNDAAFEQLEKAANGGFTTTGPPAEIWPALAALQEDPRFEEFESSILATVNRARAFVGLPPVNQDYEVTQGAVSGRL
jgi:hypothetical protein